MNRQPEELDPIWDSVASLTGFASSICISISIVDIGPPPPVAAPASLRLDAYVLAVGWSLFIWFAGSLRQRLRMNEGPNERLAATAFACAVVVAVMGLSSAVLRATSADLSGILILSEGLADAWTTLASLPAALMLGACALTGLRYRALPPPIAWSAGLFAVFILVAGAVSFLGTNVESRDGTLSMVASWAFITWVAGTSLTLTWNARGSATARR